MAYNRIGPIQLTHMFKSPDLQILIITFIVQLLYPPTAFWHRALALLVACGGIKI